LIRGRDDAIAAENHAVRATFSPVRPFLADWRRPNLEQLRVDGGVHRGPA
jgi:hypothetical protein